MTLKRVFKTIENVVYGLFLLIDVEWDCFVVSNIFCLFSDSFSLLVYHMVVFLINRKSQQIIEDE